MLPSIALPPELSLGSFYSQPARTQYNFQLLSGQPQPFPSIPPTFFWSQEEIDFVVAFVGGSIVFEPSFIAGFVFEFISVQSTFIRLCVLFQWPGSVFFQSIAYFIGPITHFCCYPPLFIWLISLSLRLISVL